LKWKKQDEKLVLTQEQYEEGPMRMKERDATQNLKHLKQVLTHEGFTEEQISHVLKAGDEKKKLIVEKMLARHKHYNEGKEFDFRIVCSSKSLRPVVALGKDEKAIQIVSVVTIQLG
jgi:hypothetical protein